MQLKNNISSLMSLLSLSLLVAGALTWCLLTCYSLCITTSACARRVIVNKVYLFCLSSLDIELLAHASLSRSPLHVFCRLSHVKRAITCQMMMTDQLVRFFSSSFFLFLLLLSFSSFSFFLDNLPVEMLMFKDQSSSLLSLCLPVVLLFSSVEDTHRWIVLTLK